MARKQARNKRTTTTRRSKRGEGDRVRRKPCTFCRGKVDEIDYKDFDTLRRFMSDKGKIRSRRVTGCCRRHQGQLAAAVKRSRELALLPYIGETR